VEVRVRRFIVNGLVALAIASAVLTAWSGALNGSSLVALANHDQGNGKSQDQNRFKVCTKSGPPNGQPRKCDSNP